MKQKESKKLKILIAAGVTVFSLAVAVMIPFIVSSPLFPRATAIDDYLNRIGGLPQFSKEINGGGAGAEIPEREYTYYEYLKQFSGEYTFAILNGKNYAVAKDGAIFEIDEDLSNYEISFDKYVYSKSEGKKGVKDIFGNIILDENEDYESFSFYNDLILVKLKSGAFQFYKGKTILNGNISAQSVKLYCDDLLLVDDLPVDYALNPLLCGGYRIFSKITGGMRAVMDGDLNFGFMNTQTNEIIIPPKYSSFTLLESGYAVGEIDGRYEMVNVSGEIIFESDEFKPLSLNKNMLLFASGGKIGVYDISLKINIISPSFYEVLNETIYGGDILVIKDADLYKIFSISKNEFFDGSFDEVTPLKSGGFIVEKDGGIFVLDSGFNAAKLDVILYDYSFEQGVLIFETVKGYHFFNL